MVTALPTADTKEPLQNGATTDNSGKQDAANSEKQSKRPLSPSIAADSTDEPPSKQRRRRRCPQKSSILISLPLTAVADLGVAMRRSRKKRVARITKWLEEVDPETRKESETKDGQNNGGEKKVKDSEEGEGSDLEQDKPKSSLDLSDDESVAAPKREQYSSVLDYLEAKYVRGVVIADYDEHGMRVKGSAKQSEAGDKEDGGKEEEGEEHYDSDQDDNRSTYGDNDGFIDDSLLHEEVVDQVFASESYGRTKIEEEAAKRKQERKKLNQSLGEMEEEDELSDIEDFDDGFFVNVGELEMAEGWRGDVDVVISTVKRKPGRPKKEGNDDVKPKKKRKVDKDADPKKKSKEGEVKKKQNKEGEVKKKKIKKKDAKEEKNTTPIKKKNSASSTSEKQQSSNSSVKTTPKKPKKEEPQTPKSIAENLLRLVKRRFNVCVKLIRELTPKQLPRKPKVKQNAKISVSIPEDKGIGDYIMFT
jgi:hypothetical protein